MTKTTVEENYPSAPLNEQVNYEPPPPYSEAIQQHPGPSVPLTGYPPQHPQHAYYPSNEANKGPIPAPPTTVIVGEFGNKPVNLICPFCQATIKTETETSISTKAWLSCLIFGLLGCYICMCLPFCMTSCYDTKHSCGNCGAHLGMFKP